MMVCYSCGEDTDTVTDNMCGLCNSESKFSHVLKYLIHIEKVGELLGSASFDHLTNTEYKSERLKELILNMMARLYELDKMKSLHKAKVNEEPLEVMMSEERLLQHKETIDLYNSNKGLQEVISYMNFPVYIGGNIFNLLRKEEKVTPYIYYNIKRMFDRYFIRIN